MSRKSLPEAKIGQPVRLLKSSAWVPFPQPGFPTKNIVRVSFIKRVYEILM
jgi:hypothetical protein